MPATGNFVLDKGYDTSVALTKKRAVKLTGEELVGPVTAATDVIAGVNQFDVTAAEIAKGKGASVRVGGIAVMEASAAITVGALVGLAADGRAAPSGVNVRVIGHCTKGCTAAGQEVSVALTLAGHLG